MNYPSTHRVLALTQDVDLVDRIASQIAGTTAIDVVATYDPLDLIEQYTARHTRLVILDVGLLDDRSVQLVEILRRIDKSCQVLLFVPRERLPICSTILSLGAVSYVVKPVSERNAARMICSALGLAFPETRVPPTA